MLMEKSRVFIDPILHLQFCARQLVKILTSTGVAQHLYYSEGPHIEPGESAIEKCFADFTKAFEELFVDKTTGEILEDKLLIYNQPTFEIHYRGFQQSGVDQEHVTTIQIEVERVVFNYQIHSNMVKVFINRADLEREKEHFELLKEKEVQSVEKVI